jgi:YD repeat-containing protein
MRCLRQIVAMLGALACSVVLVGQTLPNGPVSYAYDDMGRLIAVFDVAGNAAAYSYDAVGNITSISRYTSTQVSVLSFTPSQASIGSSISIFGTGFSTIPGQNTILFGGIAATVTAASLTQLAATVPVGATTGPITVTTPTGTATSSEPFTVMSGSVPVITGFSPNIGVPGTLVTISGSNFNATASYNRVIFNNTPAIVSTANATSVGTAVPPNATSGRLILTTPLGTSMSTSDFYVPFGTHSAADVAYTGRTTLSGTVTMTLGAPNKIGLVVFDATAGQRLNLQWTSTIPSSTPGTVYVFGPNGTQLASGPSYQTGLSNSVLLPSSGTYTIGVDSVNGSGNITLNLSDVSDLTGSIVIDGPTVTTTTTKSGQDARLSFSAVAGQRVVVRITNITNPSATASVVGVTGENLGSIGIASGSTYFLDTVPLVATGEYAVWIQHSGSYFGGETLQLSSVPPDFSAPIGIGGVPVRVPSSGDTAAGQNGILTFNASAGQKVSLSISNGTYLPYYNCGISLRSASQSILTSGYCGSGAAAFIDTIALSTAGAYTILIDPYAATTGNTTVELNDSSDLIGTLTPDGPPVIATTSIGQDARYTFSASAGQRVALRITGVTNPSAAVTLLKPDGSTQASVNITNSPSGQLFFLDTQTLTTAGTYTIWIKHNGANFGSATLQLNNVPSDYTGVLTLGVPAQVPSTGSLAIGQNAKLTVVANGGFQLNLQFSNNTIGPLTASVISPDGTTTLSSFTSSAGSFVMPLFMLPRDGTYTVVVDPTAAATGSISVLATQVGGPVPAPGRTLGSAINPDNSLSTNLVGLFVMNEGTGTTDKNLVDGQTATFSGTTLPVWNTTDPSVVLRGTPSSLSSYLNAGTDLNFDQLPTNKMTVVAKVFLNSVTQGGIAEKASSSAGFQFGLDGTGAIVGEVFRSTENMKVATGAGAITSGQWAQVAFTWDGTVDTAAAAHIYVNGVEQTKVTANDGSGTLSYAGATSQPFRVGNVTYEPGIAGSLNGKIAYMAVYKFRVLTPTELNQLDTQLPITTDVVGTTVENGTLTTVTTTAGGQSAHVTFQGWASQQVTVQLSNNTMGQVSVNLVAPDGSTVATITSSATSFSLPNATLPLTGTYDVFVRGPATPGSITVGVVTPSGGRANGSVVDANSALSTNLVGLFLMNEGTGTTDKNLVDGQTATFSGTTLPVWNTGDPSVVLSGTPVSLSSYLNAGTDLNFDQLPTSQMTVVARVFLNSVTAGGIAEKASSFAGFQFGLDGTGAIVGEVFRSTANMKVATGAGAITSGQWAQVAFTWDGIVDTAAAAHIYVNGVEQTKVTANDGSGTLSYAGATNQPFRIGNVNYEPGIAGSFNGKIAYLAVYRGRILTATELNQLDTQLPIR